LFSSFIDVVEPTITTSVTLYPTRLLLGASESITVFGNKISSIFHFCSFDNTRVELSKKGDNSSVCTLIGTKPNDAQPLVLSDFFGDYMVPVGLMSISTLPQVVSITQSGSGVRLRLAPGGNMGFGTYTATAVLHLKAGTATASTAPLKFTSGTNLTTAEAGAMEFNGTNLFFSPSTTRHTVNHGLTGSATLNFPSTTTLLSADLTITVTGAADGDVVSLGVPNAAVNANTSYSAWVSAANTVTVRFNNYSSGTVDPASGSFKVFVTK
jgi:hypothetical protein